MTSIKSSDIVTYAGEVWIVGELANGGEEIARLWPRQIKTCADGREKIAARDGVSGREGDIWAPVSECEIIVAPSVNTTDEQRKEKRAQQRRAKKQRKREREAAEFAQDVADAKEMMVDMHDNGKWNGPLLISDEEAEHIRANRTW